MTDREQRLDQEVVLAPADAVRIAMEMHRNRRFAEAERLYRLTLRAAPDHPDALHWLGVLMYSLNRPEEGRALIERSIALVPDHPDFYNNYGNALQAGEAFADAERAYRRCLALRPGQPQVWCNLGVCLRRSGRVDEAVAAYEQALSIDSDQPDVYHGLANLLRQQGKFHEAVQAYEESLERRPQYEPAYSQLARLYYSAGQIDNAAAVYRRWIEAYPEHPIPRHLLAGCTGQAVPERTSTDAVRHTFDGFADSFDRVLHGLDYQAPRVLCEQAGKTIARDGATLDILDIGCGTGLCGTLLKPWARLLVGVDLSPKMLEKARERAVYDTLDEAELVDYLKGIDAAFDLIVCADTLCYFGALEPVFSAVRQALRDGGHFVFSVESADDMEGVSSYRLHPHGRYSHRSGYLQRALEDLGLQVLGTVNAPLRRELGKPVHGWVLTARKPVA